MSFTRSTTDVHVHRNMPDFPTGEGISASDLKTAFDSEAEGIQTDLNRLATELEDTTAAASLGAAAISEGDDTDGTVQAKLEFLQSELSGIALGDIPNGTITEVKLNDEFAASIPKKDNTLQTGLNAEKINGKTDAQLKNDIIGTPSYTEINFTSHTSSGTVTETKTYNVVNSRYLLLIVTGYSNCRKILLDLKSANSYRMVYAEGGSYYAAKTNSANLVDSQVQGKVTLTTAYSNGVLTLNVTKQKTESNIPSGTITVYEIGGKV